MSAGFTASGEYVSRIGSYSLAPSWASPETCNYRMSRDRTSKLSASTLPSTGKLRWIGEFRGDPAELRRMAASNCQVAPLMRFARIPYWQDQGAIYPMGDLRYDFQPELGFGEIDLKEKPRCPPWVPRWIPPVGELLQQ